MNKICYTLLGLVLSLFTGLSQPIFPPATQSEVNAGTLPSKFVSPATLAGWTGVGNTLRLVDYQIITNYQQQIVHSAGDTTNLQIAVTTTNVIFWAPSNNCSLSVAGSWSDRNQSIVISLALTNPNITSVILPFLGPNSEPIPLRPVPSTNEITIRSNGRYQWIVSDASLYRPTTQPPVIYGYDWNSIMDAVSVTRAAPPGSVYGNISLKEDCFILAGVSSQLGLYYWNVGNGSTTAFVTNATLRGAGFGTWAIENRTSASRVWVSGYSSSSLFSYEMLTNKEVLYVERIAISGLDNLSTDTNTFRTGFMNQVPATEPTSGIYWKITNNVHELINARSGSYTTYTTRSNVAANTWYQRAWFLDRTGTNVFGFIGNNDTNMTCVATNSLNIPHDQTTFLAFTGHTTATNATHTAGRTNFVDWFYIWERNL